MATFPQRLMAYAISGADKQHPFAHPWLVMGPGNLLAGAAPQGVHRVRLAPVPASTGTGVQATVIKIAGGHACQFDKVQARFVRRTEGFCPTQVQAGDFRQIRHSVL
ncbi:hypothetical protein D3C80_778130 [compost metagenome]